MDNWLAAAIVDNWVTVAVGVLMAQAVIFGGLTAYLADQKGYGYAAWFFIGLFFGVCGLIVCAGLPLEYDARAADFVGKRCPRCDERVRVKASVCRFCHHEFNERTE